MSKEIYNIGLEPLLYRLCWLALDYKLFKGFVAEHLEKCNVSDKNDFFKQFEEYCKKHKDDALNDFYEAKPDGIPIKIQS